MHGHSTSNYTYIISSSRARDGSLADIDLPLILVDLNGCIPLSTTRRLGVN
jgi:hypothetical protein